MECGKNSVVVSLSAFVRRGDWWVSFSKDNAGRAAVVYAGEYDGGRLIVDVLVEECNNRRLLIVDVTDKNN